MKRTVRFLALLLLLKAGDCFSQASVAYYPWSSLLGVSTNPRNVLWLDTRLQTNSLFSSLSVDILPMVNLKRGEVVQLYLGGGVRLNPLHKIADDAANVITVDGYSVNFGARIAPLPQLRNLQLALELNPFVKKNIESGVLKSHFGLVYHFNKKERKQLK